ncbi:protein of unknown function [Methanocaldococcus lauensis]|uniref:Uncharacterized protein n=1 Tax=Methanocaldococcus lauensis TaxID=2546128 RepID=A0A8D6PVF6_9EURY|nr:protein of unknown function [Methanocaldococcus lauensis]
MSHKFLDNVFYSYLIICGEIMYPDKPMPNLDNDLLGIKEKAEAIKNFIKVRED